MLTALSGGSIFLLGTFPLGTLTGVCGESFYSWYAHCTVWWEHFSSGHFSSWHTHCRREFLFLVCSLHCLVGAFFFWALFPLAHSLQCVARVFILGMLTALSGGSIFLLGTFSALSECIFLLGALTTLSEERFFDTHHPA